MLSHEAAKMFLQGYCLTSASNLRSEAGMAAGSEAAGESYVVQSLCLRNPSWKLGSGACQVGLATRLHLHRAWHTTHESSCSWVVTSSKAQTLIGSLRRR